MDRVFYAKGKVFAFKSASAIAVARDCGNYGFFRCNLKTFHN